MTTREIVVKHWEKTAFLLICGAALPLVESTAMSLGGGESLTWLALYVVNIAYWLPMMAIFAVFAAELRGRTPRLRFWVALAGFGRIAALIFVLLLLSIMLISTLAAFAVFVSPSGMLVMRQTQLTTDELFHGTFVLIETPLRALINAGAGLLIATVCLFRCTVRDAVTASVLGMVSPRSRTLPLWLLLMAALSVGASWLHDWMGSSLETPIERLAAAGYGALSSGVEIVIVLALMRLCWNAMGETADEPPPILDRILGIWEQQ